MERKILELGGLGKFGKGKLVSIIETMIFLKFELVREYIILLATLSNLQYTFSYTQKESNKWDREEGEKEEATEFALNVISKMVKNEHEEIAVK